MTTRRPLIAALSLLLAACGQETPAGSAAPTTPPETVARPERPVAAKAAPSEGTSAGPSEGTPAPEVEVHASELAEPIAEGRVPHVGEASVEVLRETWDDGSPRLERSVLRDAKGLVNHGPFRRWAEDGTLLEQGEYVDGLPHGAYLELWKPGVKRREGTYEHGLRQGRWTYWTERGQLDAGRTGVYEADAKVSD